MSETDPASPRPDRPPWGLAEVVIATVASLFVSQVLIAVLFALAGLSTDEDPSLVVVAVGSATLWVGMLGAVLYVLRARGGEPRRQLGLYARWTDVPLGVVIGVACQFLLVPAVSAPWTQLLGRSLDELQEPACRLADKANDPLGVVLLALVTVVGAPIVEEVFFRGFVQRGLVGVLVARFEADGRSPVVGRALGLLATAALFGLVHFQLLQFPALVAFGLVLGVLADRTGRLGPSIVTHMAFNAATIVTLVALSSSDATCRDLLSTLVLR